MPYKDPEIRKIKSAERSLRWSRKFPEKSNAKAREWRRNNPDYMLHHHAKRRAERDGTEFSITREDIPAIPDICPIALIPIHFKEIPSKGPSDNSPTLDRIDPNRGYTKDNIRILSHKANRWKSNMTIEDVERILAYMKGQL